MVITVPNSSCMVNQKCLVVNYGLFVVQVDTASLKWMVDIALVTALFIYRQIQVTDTQDVLDFQQAAHVPHLKLYTSRKEAG
jgi:hypothetical protein